MEKRPKERIDFKILSSTGERVVRTDQQEFHGTDSTTELNADNLINSSNQLFINSIVSNQSSEEAQLTQPSSINSNMDKNSDVIDKLLIIESTLQDEIIDTMEDNAPDIIGGSIELMKSAIQKIESLRMQYRTKHRELKHHLDDKYEELHHKSYARTIADISADIRNFNQLIQHHHLVHTESAKEINDEKALFIIEDIKRSMKYIKASSTCNVNRIENDDLKRRKSQLQSQNTELRSISGKLKEPI